MNTYLAIFLIIAAYLIITLARRSNTEVGRKIRASDWYAWRMAMDDKGRELEELRRAEPKR